MRAPSMPAILFASIICIPAASHATTGDHPEFNAWLEAPFRADARGARTLSLHFSAPEPQAGGTLRWRLTLLAPDGRTLRNWHGTRQLADPDGPVTLRWRTPPALRAGVYSLRLRASAGAGPTIDQRWNVAVGAAP
ncbi:phosphotransferase, partial [Rugamonas sp. FT82W]|nr:phosphotransferase [Duganella vulcania]